MDNMYCTEPKFAQIPCTCLLTIGILTCNTKYTILLPVMHVTSYRLNKVPFLPNNANQTKQRKLNKYCFSSGNAPNEVASEPSRQAVRGKTALLS